MDTEQQDMNKIEVQLAECKVRGVTDKSLQKESSH